MIFYFSGTGNTKWIATQLANVQKEKLVQIGAEFVKSDNNFVYSLAPEETIGFVFPVYSWAPPQIVMEFIKKISFLNYNKQYLFFVCSCGDDTGLTKDVFLKVIKQKGWECQLGISVQMPNNYVLLKGFDTDPKPVEESKLKAALPQVAQINELILKKTENYFQCHEGKFPFIKTRVINPFFNKYQLTDKPFRATDNCTSCKRCEKVCPVGNVTVINKSKPVWNGFCTSCLGCYNVCPVHAVQYGKATKNKGQYFNPEYLK